ncbi:hypothetical protein DAI22_04g016200 [Oryza sativa Japonica Group]|nr:hypothetical protein DAI22_04g016200 [Oryza sativa Japonica Group]
MCRHRADVCKPRIQMECTRLPESVLQESQYLSSEHMEMLCLKQNKYSELASSILHLSLTSFSFLFHSIAEAKWYVLFLNICRSRAVPDPPPARRCRARHGCDAIRPDVPPPLLHDAGSACPRTAATAAPPRRQAINDP